MKVSYFEYCDSTSNVIMEVLCHCRHVLVSCFETRSAQIRIWRSYVDDCNHLCPNVCLEVFCRCLYDQVWSWMSYVECCSCVYPNVIIKVFRRCMEVLGFEICDHVCPSVSWRSCAMIVDEACVWKSCTDDCRWSVSEGFVLVTIDKVCRSCADDCRQNFNLGLVSMIVD